MTIYNDGLFPVREERLNPFDDFGVKAIEMELLNQQFMVDFVERFCVIEVDGIKVCIVCKRLQNIIKMVEKLCETTTARSEAMLFITNEVVYF